MNCKKECMEQKKDGTLKDCSILKENAELKKDKEWLDNTNNEQTEVILKLNEQIEKMKCCGNCKFQKNGMDYELGELCYRCEAFSNWELEE